MGSGGQPEEGQPTTNNCPTEFYLLTVVCVPATQKIESDGQKKATGQLKLIATYKKT